MPNLERFSQFEQFAFSPDHPSGPSRRPDVLARLEEAVGQIQDSESFRRYLDVQSRFHHYSANNVALILFQRPDATKVAGYNDWLKMHRYVKSGERAIKIIVPMRKKLVDEEGREEEKLFFGTGNVFDITQTDGEPLPVIEVPELHGDSDEGRTLYRRLEEFATGSGVTVQVDAGKMTERQMGYYVPATQSIVVRPAAPLQMVKTLCHELAHHFAESKESDPESETIAEAIAYVVCAHYGVDTGERSFPYIAVWSKDKAVLKKVLSTVQGISARMIDGMEKKPNDESRASV